MNAPRRAGGGAWVLEIQGRRVELRQGETTVGRSRGCGVVVKDPSVSRGHAVVWVHDDRVTVQDLRSSNGTYLNGVRVEAETPMAEGDRLTVGETQAYLRFVRDQGLRSGFAAGPPVSDGATFCPSCGRPLRGDEPRCPGCGRDLAGERLPHRSEALALGEALPVGEVLAAGSHASWDETHPPGLAPLARPAAPLAAAPPQQDLPVELEPAPFGPRAGAFALDVVAVIAGASILALPLGGPFTPRGRLLVWVLGLLLSVFLPLTGWCLWGTTPGKRLLGLTVHGPDGRAGLPVGRALLRLAGYALSALPLGAGFWMAAFHPERRALHDLVAGTSVLRARPVAAAKIPAP